MDLDDAVPACVLCSRPEDEHEMDPDEVPDLQIRLWRALGWPCGQFTLTPAGAFARNQARTSLLGARPRAGGRATAPSWFTSNAAAAAKGAADARAHLAHRTNREAS